MNTGGFCFVLGLRIHTDVNDRVAKAFGIENGLREQVLLGVTGSGKTFTMASVIEKINRPTPCGVGQLGEITK